MSIYVHVWERPQKTFVSGEKHHLPGFALIRGTREQLLGFPSFPLFPRTFPGTVQSPMSLKCNENSRLAVTLMAQG